MRILFIVLITVFGTFLIQAQITFERLYELYNEDSQGYSVVQNFDNGYIIVGSSGKVTSEKKMLVLRTDSLGDTIWVRRVAAFWGGAEGFSVLLCNDSSIVVCGRYNYNIPLVKFNQSGQIIFIKEIGTYPAQEIGFSLKQTMDNGYIIAGFTQGTGWDAYLARTDSNGDTLWTRRYGESSTADYGEDVIQTADSGFLLAGYSTNASTSLNKALLVKTDYCGNLKWLKHYGGDNENKEAKSVAETADHGFIITGYADGKILLLKLDKNGDTIWEKHLLPGWAESIRITPDQGFIITGGRQLIRTDSSGNVLWTQIFTNEYAEGMEVNLTNDLGFIIAGYSWSGYYIDRVYLVKTDENGLITVTLTPLEKNPLTAFPNPCHETLTVYTDDEIQCVDILNSLGQEIQNIPFERTNNEIKFDFSNHPPGLYSIILTTNRGKSIKKIIHW